MKTGKLVFHSIQHIAYLRGAGLHILTWNRAIYIFIYIYTYMCISMVQCSVRFNKVIIYVRVHTDILFDDNTPSVYEMIQYYLCVDISVSIFRINENALFLGNFGINFGKESCRSSKFALFAVGLRVFCLPIFVFFSGF